MEGRTTTEWSTADGAMNAQQSQWGQRVAELVLSTYNSLGANGKPAAGEYTVVAAVVASYSNTPMDNTRRNDSKATKEGGGKSSAPLPVPTEERCKVLAVGSGTRSVGFKEHDSDQTAFAVADCHAEVIARRSFLRYLLQEIEADVEQFLTTATGSSNPSSSVDDAHQWRVLECVKQSAEPRSEGEDEASKGASSPESTTGTNGAGSTGCLPLRWRLRKGVRLHIYISQSPCGDCSLVVRTPDGRTTSTSTPASEGESSGSDAIPIGVKRTTDRATGGREIEFLDECQPPPRKQRLEGEVPLDAGKGEKLTVGLGVQRTDAVFLHETGAPAIVWDPVEQQSRIAPHKSPDDRKLGVVRHKPGKGTPSLCMSCSDKIVRWQVCGLQGALLSPFVPEALCFSSVVVDRGCPWDRAGLARGLSERIRSLGGLPIAIVGVPRSSSSEGGCGRQSSPLPPSLCRPAAGDSAANERQASSSGSGSCFYSSTLAPTKCSTGAAGSGSGSGKPTGAGCYFRAINMKTGTPLGLVVKQRRNPKHALQICRFAMGTRVKHLLERLIGSRPNAVTYHGLKQQCGELEVKALSLMHPKANNSTATKKVEDAGRDSDGNEEKEAEELRSYAERKASALREGSCLAHWIRKHRADFSFKETYQ